MSNCAIKLDNYQGQYYPGDRIIGKVVCTFSSSKSIRGIELELKGEERNSWMGTETNYDRGCKKQKTKIVHYTGRETFLYRTKRLHGEGEIGPGNFEYAFNFNLPPDLPGTYKGQYGGVSFSLDVKVDRPYRFDYTDSVDLTVVAPINFNLIRDRLQLEPVSYSEDKTICCWCCSSDPLTMEVHLEKQAFVLGEEPRVGVHVTNMSNVNIESVKVELIIEVTSKVTHPKADSKRDTELLAIARDTGVGAHGQRTYDFRLDVPQSTPLPNFSLCELFSQRCKIEVTAVLPGCHTNMETASTVTMGNIPLYDPGTHQPITMPPPYPPTEEAGPGPIGFPVPQEACPGPSAPPDWDGASAPPKEGAVENQFVLVEGETDDPWPAELPPPSYNEATSRLLKN